MEAGKGTRMNTKLPKVLHTLKQQSMIEHVINKTIQMKPDKIVVVVGYKSELVKKHLINYNVEYAIQHKQL